MQSEETKIHRLYSQVSLVYKTLLDCFLKTDYLKSTMLEKVEFENPHNFVPLDDIYLGPKVTIALSEKSGGLTALELKDFRTRCLQFYIEACSQIMRRFNLKSESSKIFKDLSILDPSQMSKFKSVAPIAAKFPNLVSENDLNILDAEWRELRNIEVDIDSQKPSIEYWNSVSQMQLGDGTAKFKTLSRFMIALHCLPHSSATVERIFSQVQLSKSKIRNRLEN